MLFYSTIKNIKLVTEYISGITKPFSNKQNQEKPFISPKKHAKNINKTASTDKNNITLANLCSNLTDTNKWH